MKRIRIGIFIIAAMLFVLPFSVSAAQDDDIRAFSDFDSLWDALPSEVEWEGVQALLEGEDPKGIFAYFGEKILAYCKEGFQKQIGFFIGLCLILLISAVTESVKDSFSPSLRGAFDLLFLLSATVFSYEHFSETLSEAAMATEGIASFMIAVLPVNAMLLTLSGSVKTAVAQNTNISLVLSIFSTLIHSVLMPLCKALFCFSFLSGQEKSPLKGMIVFGKKTVKTICIFCFSTLLGILGLTHALASSADSVAMRSVRFAAGTFIPIIGSAVGEGSKTLGASLRLVKTQCGVLCIAVLAILILKPLLLLYIQKLFLSFAASVGEILGESRCSGFFRSIGQVLDLIAALLISQGCYLIFYITLFINSGGNL